MELTWAEKLKEEGRKQGRLEGLKEAHEEWRRIGLIESKRDTLLRLLTSKFGPLPVQTTTRVTALELHEELDAYLDRVLTANGLADMGLDA